MTRDDIIRMAREAGAIILDENPVHTAVIERFAVLVAEAEREDIATWYAKEGWLLDEEDVPDAIRARIQQTGANHE